MAEIQRTYTFTAELTRGGHRLLDEALETCRRLYNDFLTVRKTAYTAMGVSVKGRSQSAPVKRNRAAGDEPTIPEPDARAVYVDSEPTRPYGGMSMTGLGPAQRRRRAEGYGCSVAELEPQQVPHSIRRELNPNERKELADARKELANLNRQHKPDVAYWPERQLYRLWCVLWPGDAEAESLQQQYAWTRWRHRNDWPELEDAVNHIDDKSSLSDQLTTIRGIDRNLDGINRRLEVASVIERMDKAFAAFFDGIKSGRKVGYPRYKGRNRLRTLEIYAGANSYLKVREPGRQWHSPDKPQFQGTVREKNRQYIPPKGQIPVGAKAKIIISPGLPPIRFDIRQEIPECQPLTIRITRKARRVQARLYAIQAA